MAVMSCHGCEALIEDTELFCEHCGAPTIPQKTRSELQHMADRGAEKSSRWTHRLSVTGAIIGIALSLLFGLVVTPIVDPGYWIAALCFEPFFFVFVFGFVGVIIDAAHARSRRK